MGEQFRNTANADTPSNIFLGETRLTYGEVVAHLDALAAERAKVAKLREALVAAFPTLHYYGHKPGEQHVNASPPRRVVGDALDLARAALSEPASEKEPT